MLITTLRWDQEIGWSAPFPDHDGPTTFVLAFGPSSLLDDPTPLHELHAAFPRSAVVGCSTSGEIDGDSVDDGSVVVTVTRFDDVALTVVPLEVPDAAASRQAGEAAARRLLAAQPALQAAFVLSDGLGVNGSTLVEGLTAVLPPEVVITGGLAGDGDRFERTWVLVDGEPRAHHVVAVGLSGPGLLVGYGSQGGWEIFGPERRITRAEGNVLYELDGQPALALYKKYLGDRRGPARHRAALPLALRIPGAEHRQVVAHRARHRRGVAVDDLRRDVPGELVRAADGPPSNG
ncbi:MAG: FIST N-terminal domain-containing protein [Acidimicrobiales bacterium]